MRKFFLIFIITYFYQISFAQKCQFSVNLNPIRPDNSVDFKFEFIGISDFTKINSHIEIRETEFNYPNVYSTSKRYYDKNSVVFTLGGMDENKSYTFQASLSDKPINGSTLFDTTITITTSINTNIRKTVLLVIDNVWEKDNEINSVLQEYRNNIDYNVEYYWISNSNKDKSQLFDIIKSKYLHSNLQYLFFIGKNALINRVNYENNILQSYKTNTFHYYTRIWNNDFEFDSINNTFYKDFTWDTVLDPIHQSNVFLASPEISFSAICPNTSTSSTSKKYILDYFKKLLNYRKGNIKFDNNILISNVNSGENALFDTLKRLNKFADVVTVERSQNPTIEYVPNDDVWTHDYLDKLNEQSFKMVLISAHGGETMHQFNITSEVIRKMNNLNSFYYDFLSCNTGNITFPDYLAGTYLNTGNTLLVNANLTISWATENDLLYSFSKEYRTTNYNYQIINGSIISDAHRRSNPNYEDRILLGDPLLSLPEFYKMNMHLNGDINLYPNPAIDYIDIEIINLEKKNINLSISSLEGKTLITTTNINITERRIIKRLNIESLKKGLYIISVTTGSEIISRKFVK